MSKSSSSRPAHRPPSGPGGERVSDYPRVAVRLPPLTKAKLEALATLSRVPVWQLVDTAVVAYIERLPDDERRLIAQFARKAVDA